MKGFTVRAWAGSARPGRCRWCRRAIVWVTVETGANMPFDLGFTVREVVTHPVTMARFIVLHRDDRHTCRPRQQKANKRSHGGVL